MTNKAGRLNVTKNMIFVVNLFTERKERINKRKIKELG